MIWLPATITIISDALARLFGGIGNFILVLIGLIPGFPKLVRAAIAAALVWGFLKLLMDGQGEAATAVAIPMMLAIKWYFENESGGPSDTSSTGM